jgi:hypothetical protein
MASKDTIALPDLGHSSRINEIKFEVAAYFKAANLGGMALSNFHQGAHLGPGLVNATTHQGEV